LAYIFAADSTGLSSFKFVQWAAKDASILQQSAGRKRIFTSNSHSRSFKVIHFATSYRPTRGSILPYNIAGLISEDSEVVATQIAKNCRRRQLNSATQTAEICRHRQPPHSFDAPAKRNSHMGSISSYDIACRISEVFEHVAT